MAKKTSKTNGENVVYAVGDQIKAKLNDGRVVAATVRAVSQQDGEVELNIDYGHEETATIALWQVER